MNNTDHAARPLPAFLSFGEALTDLLRSGTDSWRSSSGGAPWNMARAMAALGQLSAFGGAVSSDLFGRALLDESCRAGLDPRFIQCVDHPPLLAVVHQLDPPAYFFVGGAHSADQFFDPAQLPAGWQDSLRWAHFGGISLVTEPLAGRLLTLAGELKARGVRISYDPNYRPLMDARYDATLERMCRLADVIKVSDEDLCGLFRQPDAARGLARIRAWNPEALLLQTLGADGARLWLDDSCWQARPPAVTVLDTVGAGDASMAGFLTHLMEQPGADPGRWLACAVGAGALACTLPGAQPPARADWLALSERVLASPVIAVR